MSKYNVEIELKPIDSHHAYEIISNNALLGHIVLDDFDEQWRFEPYDTKPTRLSASDLIEIVHAMSQHGLLNR